MVGSGQQDAAPSARLLSPARSTPGRCCWPGGKTFFLIFHSPGGKKKFGIRRAKCRIYSCEKAINVQIGICQTKVFFPTLGMQQQNSLKPLNIVCQVPQTTGGGCTVGRQYILVELNRFKLIFHVCADGASQKVRGALFAASNTSPSFSTPRS